MLNKEIPFLRICIPLCIGIISSRFFEPGAKILILSAAISLSGFCFSTLFNSKITNVPFGLTLTFSLFIEGIVIYKFETGSLSDFDPVKSSFICTLSEFPEQKGTSTRMILKLNSKITSNNRVRVKGSVLVYLRNKKERLNSYTPGDILVIGFKPLPIENRGNPDEFDNKFYMQNNGIKYQAFVDEKDIIYHGSPDRRKIMHRALILREEIIKMYEKRGITGEKLALVAAITLGQKNLLDPELKQNFIKAGIMHIMAVSGLHAVILSVFIHALLFFLKGKFGFLRVIITIIFLWSFAFITGLTPSVLRATIMFTFIQAGRLMNRNVNNINSVLASAFFLILFKPSVIYDAGFLLSYSAVIYIICFYKTIYELVEFKNWLADKIWQSASVTIAAQAGTFALTISLFNRFPIYFLLTNIIIVPVSSLMIITGCLIPATFPLRFLSQILARLLEILTGITGYLTRISASLPCSTIENIGMGKIETTLLSASIFLLMANMANRRIFHIRYSLFFFLLFSLAVTSKDINNKISNELIVYNTQNSCSVGIRSGRNLNLFTDDSVARPEVIKHCAAEHFRLRYHHLSKEICTLKAGDNHILICKDLDNIILQISNPDIVVIYGNKSTDNKPLSFPGHVRLVIFTSASKPGYSFIKDLNLDSLHIVKNRGAFRFAF